MCQRCYVAGKLESVDPPGAVAILENPETYRVRNWTRSDCANGLFFVSADAASEWLADHPDYIVVPMEFFVRAETEFTARALAEAALPIKLR